MGDVKSSVGVDELREKARVQSEKRYVDERQARVKADKDRKETSAGNMVLLGNRRNKRFAVPETKSSIVDLSEVVLTVKGGKEEKTVLALTPNITLDLKEKVVDRGETDGTFVGWGDQSSVAEGAWSPPVWGQEDNSAW